MHQLARSPLALALFTALAAAAATEQPSEDEKRLDRLVVRASPLALPAEELIQPAAVLAGDSLDRVRASTLGETVNAIPGVHSSWFGPGVGRPIVRGLEGGRIGVLSANLPVIDASTSAADHAVAVEPLLAERVEVLKGPATLLYGSGAAGGLVQILDGRIAEQPHEGLQGTAELRGDRAFELRAGAVKLGLGARNFVFRIDGFERQTEDYRIPRGALDQAHHSDQRKGLDDTHQALRVENSATHVRGLGAGLTWFGEGAEFGVAIGQHLSRYGVPGHGHHGHEHSLRHVRSAKNGDDHGHEVEIDLASTRAESRIALERPLAFLEGVDFRLAGTRYRHQELEAHEDEIEIGTRFRISGFDGRLELKHLPLGAFRGVFGWQFGDRQLKALGEEAFLPPHRQAQWGLFVLERLSADPFDLEFGLRYEQQQVRDLSRGERIRHRPFSFSLGARHALSKEWHLQGILARQQRAPQPEELLAEGPHTATRAYEIGDPGLELETGRHAELGLHWHGTGIELGASLYHTDFDRFVYLADTGEFEDGLPVRRWTQADARFTGFELEGALDLHQGDSGQWRLVAMADAVRGRLKQGGWLPRIAPARQALGMEWSSGGWSAGVRATRYARQTRLAAGEEETAGFTLLHADLVWRFGQDGRYRLALAGRNLGDRSARLHTSYLKDEAPLPGRNLLVSLRVSY